MGTYRCVYCKGYISKDYLNINVDYTLKNQNEGIEILFCPHCERLLNITRCIYKHHISYMITDDSDIYVTEE